MGLNWTNCTNCKRDVHYDDVLPNGLCGTCPPKRGHCEHGVVSGKICSDCIYEKHREEACE